MDFDLVEDGLYLGSRRALQQFLKSNGNATIQVLTIESENLSQVPQEVSQHKFIQVDDLKTEDLLSHFDDIVAFIKTGLAKGMVYVHCRHGISRSATACAAYLMAQHEISADAAIQRLRQRRPCVCPNAGFSQQLELYGELGCSTSLGDPRFRRYRLRAAAKAAGMDITRLPAVSEPLLRVPEAGGGGCSGRPAAVYRCGQCRTALFTDRAVLHDPEDQRSGSAAGSLRLLPLPWMTAALRLPSGRLSCPRCSRKLGSFSWLPDSSAAPDDEFEPFFLVTRSRVDHCPPRLTACTGARHLAGKSDTTTDNPVDR